jgi:CRP/FNR family transcriptional regulator, cyclic AMP receptor protein
MFASGPRSPGSLLSCPFISTAYPKGAILFMEGQKAEHVVSLRAGRIKLSILSPEGNSFVLRIAQPGEILGITAATVSYPHQTTAETLDYCEVDLIRTIDLVESLRKDTQALIWAAQQVAAECRETCQQIKLRLLGGKQRERLAVFLLQLPALSEQGDLRRIGMTHEQVAEMIGTSRETVTRLLRDFRLEALVEIKQNGLISLNSAALRRICHLEESRKS